MPMQFEWAVCTYVDRIALRVSININFVVSKNGFTCLHNSFPLTTHWIRWTYTLLIENRTWSKKKKSWLHDLEFSAHKVESPHRRQPLFWWKLRHCRRPQPERRWRTKMLLNVFFRQHSGEQFSVICRHFLHPCPAGYVTGSEWPTMEINFYLLHFPAMCELECFTFPCRKCFFLPPNRLSTMSHKLKIK